MRNIIYVTWIKPPVSCSSVEPRRGVCPHLWGIWHSWTEAVPTNLHCIGPRTMKPCFHWSTLSPDTTVMDVRGISRGWDATGVTCMQVSFPFFFFPQEIRSYPSWGHHRQCSLSSWAAQNKSILLVTSLPQPEMQTLRHNAKCQLIDVRTDPSLPQSCTERH